MADTTEFIEPPTIMMTIPSPPPSEPASLALAHASLAPASLAPASLPPATLAHRPLTPVPEIMEPATLEPAALEPATPLPFEPFALEPAEPAEPATLEPATLVPARQSKVDLLFTALSTNTVILSTVHTIKSRSKFEESRSKFEASDIPILLLGIYNEYQNNNKKIVLTIDDLQILIERVYHYLVDKYTLIDPENQAACFLMFTSALKLLLAVPAVKNKKCFFTCF